MNIPLNLFYTASHEWILIDNDSATVGITDYAQGELGDIVYLELPEVGSDAVKGSIFGTIEAVKTVADLYAPLSGTVTEINQALDDEPELVNHDPYGEGWFCKIELSSLVQSKNLLSADEYTDIVG
ncbi:MAG: glycine cleavage system protein H [Candidatus Marinimicrobia bacterium]|nr:glycine cleavage system protein H [Candidatus Neomarinimicrobiota bacterium]